MEFYERLEIVRIAPRLRLFDDNSYQRSYLPPHGVALEPGLYIVHWPAQVTARRFDEQAVYLGPFADLGRAREALSIFTDCLSEAAAETTPGPVKLARALRPAASEAAPRTVTAVALQDFAPATGMSDESELDPQSRGDCGPCPEELEFVAEWARSTC